jgi:hypothetical protein
MTIITYFIVQGFIEAIKEINLYFGIFLASILIISDIIIYIKTGEEIIIKIKNWVKE